MATDQIQQIKNSLNIVDVLGSYLELKKAGKNYKGNCPFHNENTPSFMVSPDLQMYKCFGCGESGDIFGFVMKIEGLEFFDAAKILADKAGIKLTQSKVDPKSKEKKQIYEINKLTTEFYSHLLLNHSIGKRGLSYLIKDRKLTKKSIKDFMLGIAPNNWEILTKYLVKKGYTYEQLVAAGVTIKSRRENYIDKFRDRIVFPLTGTNGKILGFTGRSLGDNEPKYLNSPETLVFNKSSYLYGLDHARIAVKNSGALFVEGQMDVIAAHQNGITNAIATSGTSLTNTQLKILSRYTNDLIFCFDSDSAGRAAMLRAIEMAEAQDFNSKVALIPDNYKDLDELITSSISKAKKVVEDAISIYDYFIIDTFATHDPDTAIGKKKALTALNKNFSKLDNNVLKDHYTKKLAKKLNLNEQTVLDAVFSKKPVFPKNLNDSKAQDTKREEQSLQEYLLGLIFNAKLDLSKRIMYKLSRSDFNSPELQEVFTNYKNYIKDRKREVNVAHFTKKLNSSQQKVVETILLRDYGQVTVNQQALEKELDATFKRLKLANAETELDRLNKELKDAEEDNNAEEIEKLSQKVYKVSKQKNQYNLT